MLTRDGICYKLLESPYTVKTGDIIFYFSSEFYKQKFLEEQYSNREKISNSLTNRFDIKISVPNTADIVLYSKIEKRGFYLVYKGVEFECKKSLILHGEKASKIN